MSTLAAPVNPKDLLLQTSPGRSPHPLELLVRLDGHDESHFYTQGLTMTDFGSLFGLEIRALDAFVTRMPAELLNPNYWEPLTKESENAVRERMSGIITRTEGDRALLFRADRISRGRLLRDGLDIPVELVNGYLFQMSGEALLKLGQAWTGRNRFDWAGLTKGPITPDTLTSVHRDLSQSRLSLREEQFLFATQDDGLSRVVFAKRTHFYRALEALVRGFIHGAAGVHVGRMSRSVLEEIADLADGIGLSADPVRDVVNSGRTVEVSLWLGRSPWGTPERLGREALLAKEKALLYYDSISGLWDLAS
ncbi:MAG TPA: hypothetical protein VKW04_22065 [Planctomycetota bacterium]|nr:hypothetical protein [Planctomycetota bacterium]